MDGRLNFPTVSRSGRILKKSTRWIEAEESLMTEACLVQTSQNDSERFIDVVHDVEEKDSGVKGKQKTFISKAHSASSLSNSASSVDGNESSMSFKDLDVMNNGSCRKRFDYKRDFDSTNSNPFSSIAKGGVYFDGTFDHFGMKNNISPKNNFNRPESICSTSFSSIRNGEACCSNANTFHRFDVKNNVSANKIISFSYFPNSIYLNSLNDNKNSYKGIPDGMRMTYTMSPNGEFFYSKSRPDSSCVITISSSDDEQSSSVDSGSESNRTSSSTSSSSENQHDESVDDLLLCQEQESSDHRYCTRFQHTLKPELTDVATNVLIRKPQMEIVQSSAKARKMNLTAFNLWSSLNRKVIRAASMHLPRREISKKVQKVWQVMPVEEKQFWARKAAEISERIPIRFICSISGEEVKTATGLVPKNSVYEGSPMQTKRRQEKMYAYWKKNMRKNYEKERVGDPSTPLKEQSKEHVLGIAPIDAAAHLNLLGDSLTQIGQKILTAGIKPSDAGTYSTLLDSLLCSVGALLCVTREIPGLEQLPEEPFRKTLDHIAYFFPGLKPL